MTVVQLLVLYADHTWWSVFTKKQIERLEQEHGAVIKIFAVNDLQALEMNINEISD